MKIQLLPSTFDQTGSASKRQHLASFVLDDRVAIDAGSLAFGVNDLQRQSIRDIIITHPHLDHIAGLPLFVDDLFSELKSPLRIHATAQTVEILEEHVFNWKIYPRFSELRNEFGAVLEYRRFQIREKFAACDFEFLAVPVNHQVETAGFIVTRGARQIAFTSDTAETEEFWHVVNALPRLDALFIECAFPDRKKELAGLAHHLTPEGLKKELAKFKHDCSIFAINIKPMFREEICAELAGLQIPNLQIMRPGEIYEL